MKKLFAHQRAMLAYLSRTDFPALFVDMRLGKTVVTVRRLKGLPRLKKILLAAPYSAFNSWTEELRESNETFSILEGTREERLQKLKIHVRWYLINKEGYRTIPEIATAGFDCVILDESTFIKNPKAGITKFFCSNFREASSRWILTGTPNPETDLDYFCQYLFLDSGKHFGRNYWIFRQTNFLPIGYDFYPSTLGRRNIASVLRRTAFFLKRRDVRDGFKEKTYIQRRVELPENIRKVYRKAEEDFLLELPDGEIGSTLYATERFLWLRMLASGFYPEGTLAHRAKIDELNALLDGELKNEQVVIWASFINELRFLKSHLSERGETAIVYGAIPQESRRIQEKRFREGKIRYFVAHPECYKFGANLATADTSIYYSTTPSFLARSQSEDRIINLQKKRPVLIIDLITAKTVDEDLQLLIKTKSINASITRAIVKRMERDNEKAK